MKEPTITDIPDDLINPLGQWTEYSKGIQRPYGEVRSYIEAAKFLDIPNTTVEDWGCGWGYARQFFKHAKYIGVDGSQSAYCDVVDDLRTRVSSADGILLRHVLEHNIMWQWVLQSAIRAANSRICLVFFLPFANIPNVARDPKPGVVVVHMVERDVESILSGWSIEKVTTGSPNNYEQTWFCAK